jgi:DNA-binding IclR family transcriptional regulator
LLSLSENGWENGAMAGTTVSPGTSMVSRVLAMLTAFDAQHRRVTLTELATRTGLPVPTAYRIARELVHGGALVRDGDGRYAVGRLLWDVGLLAPLPTGLRELAAPFLADLHATTRATVHLAVRDGQQVLYLDRLSGHASVPIVSTIGSRLPLHATGVGKVLLAHAPDDVREQVLARLPRLTPYTITQPARLRAQLDRARRDGYATTHEEMSLGACSVAVPVRRGGPDGPVGAAIGVVLPSLKRDRRLMVTALQVAAQGIGRNLNSR